MTDPNSADCGTRLSDPERTLLHSAHAVPINPTHEGCPLCNRLEPLVRSIVADRLTNVTPPGDPS